MAYSTTHSAVGHLVPEPLAPVPPTSRTAVHLFRPHLENMCLLLLQNGSRTLRWQGPRWPAMLPTTKRPTGTLRQDLQCPMQWDKNVSCHLFRIMMLIKKKKDCSLFVCFFRFVTHSDLLWGTPDSVWFVSLSWCLRACLHFHDVGAVMNWHSLCKFNQIIRIRFNLISYVQYISSVFQERAGSSIKDKHIALPSTVLFYTCALPAFTGFTPHVASHGSCFVVLFSGSHNGLISPTI